MTVIVKYIKAREEERKHKVTVNNHRKKKDKLWNEYIVSLHKLNHLIFFFS